MKTAIVINPNSGQGRGKRVWQTARKELETSFSEREVLVTSEPGDARKFCRKLAAEGFDQLILIGGDGSLHECVNGIMQTYDPEKRIRIGVLSGGSGCDFSRSLGSENDLKHELRRIKKGRRKKVDVMKVSWGDDQTSYAINSSSMGLSARVADKVASWRSFPWPNQWNYLIAGAINLIDIDSFNLRITTEDKEIAKSNCLMAFVLNGAYSGNGMHWSNQAVIDDGLLQLVVIEKPPLYKVPNYIPKMYQGKLEEVPFVQNYSAKKARLEVENTGQPICEMDGEVYLTPYVDIEVLPQSLEFFTD